MSKEVGEELSKQTELDSILDAALDDLESDGHDRNEVDGDIGTESNLEPGKSTGEIKASSTGKNVSAKNSTSHDNCGQLDFNEEELAASLEDMMKHLMHVGEQLGADETNTDVALDSLLQSMQSQVASELQKSSFQEKSAEPNVSTNSSAAKVEPASQESEVDRTVAKLLDDMAKVGSAGDGMEAGNVEQMGEEMMENMMKEFEKMGQKGDADDVIDGMMKQLLSKELMYEPMKQVTERFPRWLAESKPHLSEEDYNRYGHQYQYFQRIVAVYESEPDNFPRLMELMQDIQEYGQPPADIIKELAPGLEFDEEGMPKMDMGMGGTPLPPGSEQCSIM